MNIVLLGAPGSGKGFISGFLKSEYNLTHISTGDLLRQNIKEQTELGKLAKTYIDKGEFVPDDLVLGMLKQAIESGNKNGIIFDGYPRNIAQADTLSTLVNVDTVISVEVPKDIIVSRIMARRVCSNCSTVYSVNDYKKDTCEKCGGTIIQRADDVPDVIEHRLNKYVEQTEPLIQYYKKLNKLAVVDNSGDATQTQTQVKNIVEKIKSN